MNLTLWNFGIPNIPYNFRSFYSMKRGQMGAAVQQLRWACPRPSGPAVCGQHLHCWILEISSPRSLPPLAPSLCVMWPWRGLRAVRPGTAWIGSVRFQISADEKCWSCNHRQELLTQPQRHAFRMSEREEGERMASFSLFLGLHKWVRGRINAERRRTERQEDRPEGRRRDSWRAQWGGVCSSVVCLRGRSEMLSNTMEQVLRGVGFQGGGERR